MKDQLINTGLEAIRHGEKIGVSEIEVYLESVSSIEVSVEANAIKTVSKKTDTGCGIRTIDANRIGYAYATTTNPPDVMKTVDASHGMARISSPDKDFVGLLSGTMKYPEVKKIYDPLIASMEPEDAIEIVQRAIQANHELLQNKGTPQVASILEAKNIIRVILNSNGVSCESQSTQIGMFIESTIKIDGMHSSSWKDESSTALHGIDPESIGRIAGERTLGTIGAKKMNSGVMPVVLSPDSVATIFNNGRPGSFSSALSALNVINKNSYLVDLIGSEIGSDLLTIVDDGQKEAGLFSRPFDAEGYPSRRTELVREGVLQGYLHDSYTAQKTGLENTGNAGRKSYTELPKIAASNFVVAPGRGSEEDLIAEIDYGLYCRFTGDYPNSLSGDLNAVVMEGHLIENGEHSHPVQNTMFSMNIIDLLKGITRIGGNQIETERGTYPTIAVESATVSSGN